MRPRKGRCRIEVTKANIAYKFELMPTREQKRIFAQATGWRRFVWNKAIELQKRCLSQVHGVGRTVGAVEKGRRHVVVAGSAFSGTSTVPDGRVCCNRSVQGQEKGLPKVPSSGRRGFLPHSASSPDGLGRSQRSSPHPEGRLRAIQKVASDSRLDQADDGFRRMRALVCLGRDGDGFRQRRSASSRRGRH